MNFSDVVTYVASNNIPVHDEDIPQFQMLQPLVQLLDAQESPACDP